LGLLANALLCYGGWTRLLCDRWQFGDAIGSLPLLVPLLWFNAALLTERMAVRIFVVAEVYGLGFALLSPLRTQWGNCLNSAACARALHTWLRWRLSGVPLRWVKTEHAYPNREALAGHRRELGEILISNGCCAQETVELALEHIGESRLGEYLVMNGFISEQELCEAMSLHQGMPMARLKETRIRPNIARSIPESLQREHGLLPMDAREGELHIAAVEAPSEVLVEELRRYTRLSIRFWLATRSDIGRARATLQSPS
jgi:hypothetical protein